MATTSTPSRGSGVDLPTLAVTAAASAGAAYVCSKIWAPGTLASAAFTPVIVAVLKEAFARPTYAVTRAVPVRGVVRSAGQPDADPGAPGSAYPAVEERVPQQGEIPGWSGGNRRRGWRIAVVTGLLGFLVAAVIITVPEFVAGKAASGGGRGTTLFGGHERTSTDPSTTTTTTTRSERTRTTPAGATVTVPPVETTTVPAQTTTVPPPTTTAPQPAPVAPSTTTPQPPAP